MNFGQRLKYLRNEYGYTQEYVAKTLNVGRPTISGYETKSIYPDYDKLLSLANLFNCSTDFLLGRTDLTKIITENDLYFTSNILKMFINEGYIDPNKVISKEKTDSICNELHKAFSAINLLKKIQK